MNQLFWRERPIYDELIEASQQLRAAYRDQLAGKSPDVRGAEDSARAAVKRATQTARAIIEADGSKASDAVMEAVRETLDILPSADPPGRLTRPLKRTGFEALEGFTIAAKPRPVPTRLEPKAAGNGQAQADRVGETRQRGGGARARHDARAAAVRGGAEREAEAALDRARRAVERAVRTRERIERELERSGEHREGLAAKSSRRRRPPTTRRPRTASALRRS